MAFDVFIKIDGIPGESSDDKHKEWIEVLGFSPDRTAGFQHRQLGWRGHRGACQPRQLQFHPLV